MGRTVAITGAGSGLNALLAARFAARGDTVIGIDVRGADVTADLATPEGRDLACAAVRGRAGRLDALVAGAGLGPHVPDLAAMVSVNYFGAVGVLERLLDLLAAGDRPAAVAIGSTSGTMDPTIDGELMSACLAGDEAAARERGAELPGNTGYASAKRALMIWVRRQVGPWGERGVRLNTVAPGPFESAILQGTRDDPVLGPYFASLPIPLERVGTREEVSAVVEFLLSPAASLVHGSVWTVDGGSDALLYPDRCP